VLRNPGLATDARFASNSRRTAARDALRPIIVDTFATLTGRGGGGAAGRGRHRQRAHERHACRVVACAARRARPLDAGRFAGGNDSRAAAAGHGGGRHAADGPHPGPRADNTDAILRELGYDADAVARLHAEGAV
jgi:crotonobetainyl-CoA:carnitine CoA-transferase CaiB-like acyl-CoA transferase